MPRCSATTLNGRRCRQSTAKDVCHIHLQNESNKLKNMYNLETDNLENLETTLLQLKKDENPTLNKQLIKDGTFAKLVGFTNNRTIHTSIRVYACWILSNMCADSDAACVNELIKLNGHECLLENVKNDTDEDSEIVSQSIWCLANIAATNEECARRITSDQHTIYKICGYISSVISSSELRKTSAHFIRSVACVLEYNVAINVETILLNIPPATLTDLCILQDILHTINRIYKNTRVFNIGFINILLEQLKGICCKIAFTLLGDMIAQDSAIIDELIRRNILAHVMKFVGKKQYRDEALWVLSNLMCHTPIIKQFCKKSDYFLRVIYSANKHYDALFTICNLLTHVNSEQLSSNIIEWSGLIQCLIRNINPRKDVLKSVLAMEGLYAIRTKRLVTVIPRQTKLRHTLVSLESHPDMQLSNTAIMLLHALDNK